MSMQLLNHRTAIIITINGNLVTPFFLHLKKKKEKIKIALTIRINHSPANQVPYFTHSLEMSVSTGSYLSHLQQYLFVPLAVTYAV